MKSLLVTISPCIVSRIYFTEGAILFLVPNFMRTRYTRCLVTMISFEF